MESLGEDRHHEIYVERCGNPDGIPIVFLHGGPGSGCRPMHRRFFDPKKYHIILFDQRGCGRSLPHGEIAHNSTQYLVSDMETLRSEFNLEQWVVFGGSWGATLALIYAQTHPERVLSLILRGVFLGRQQDIDWVYAEGGASTLFPDAWHKLVAHLPEEIKPRPLQHYYNQLTQHDELVQMSSAKTLQAWESTIVTLRDYEYEPDLSDEPAPLAHSRIQLHFALNACFLQDNQILNNIDVIRHIPTQIIHGRYDIVCPIKQSWELHQVWPEASLTVVPMAGHAAGESAIVSALIKATRQVLEQLS
jgi:proline iminopeptidase